MNRPAFLVIHHTGGTNNDPLADTSHHTFEIVDNYHKSLWNFRSSLGHYIGYHYFIEKDGKVTQGRADTDEGAHTRGMNTRSIGICLAGNFDATKPSKKQEKALAELLTTLAAKYNIPAENVVPHRKYANKTCYGTNLSDTWARDLLLGKNPCRVSKFTTVELINELKLRIEKGTL